MRLSSNLKDKEWRNVNMTEQINNESKEYLNRVIIVGTLVAKHLEEGAYTNQDGTIVERIVGTISVRTGENKVHQIRLRSNKLTKAGTENGLYKGYVTVRNEYISQADVAEAAKKGIELVADVISVDGKLRPFQQINGVTINRIDDKEQHFQASFEATIKLDRVLKNVGSRMIIKAEAIEYKPFNLTLSSPIESSEFFLEDYLRGKMMKVGGEILGETKGNEYVADLLINNGALIYEE